MRNSRSIGMKQAAASLAVVSQMAVFAQQLLVSRKRGWGDPIRGAPFTLWWRAPGSRQEAPRTARVLAFALAISITCLGT